MTLVKNVIGSSKYDPPSGYSSWREYWEDKMKRRFSDCSRVDCIREAEDGGHVKLASGSNKYIVPLCKECNNPANTDPFFVRDNDLLTL